MHNWQETERNTINDLVKIIKLFHKKGLSPATSTNYSVRSSYNKNHYIISQSGIDKSDFSAQDFMLIDLDGKSLENNSFKTSAETLIHTAIYAVFTDVTTILHTHSLPATFLSMKTSDNQLSFEGLELLKGLEGNLTHELTEIIPIFPNSQDIKALSLVIKDYLISNPKIHGIILKGHGLYTWGKDLKSAKRHVETFEYLFNYKLMEYGHGHSTLSTK